MGKLVSVSNNGNGWYTLCYKNEVVDRHISGMDTCLVAICESMCKKRT